ncbi:MmyB family transcriptional regulator [Streptomyces massasporeus]|uniref:MmyB family transcriptional regulator n=1 Tax=Streptomyces massasporeus TaxID=67324 RepID=UPI00167B6594|nr:hypothetical protein [Streptomyces massasporeus]GGV84995.1 hypothetical protein GCM10010228_63750 [Streptomyces massasporeus]
MQLQPMERDHASRLAGLLPPQEGTISTHVPAGVLRMLARLRDFPVGVFSADWTLLSWTPAWAVLLGDSGARTPAERIPTVVHPEVGEVTCDCDVLTVPGSDIRLIVYTVAAGSTDAEKLEFLRVTNGVRAEGSPPSGPGRFSRP